MVISHAVVWPSVSDMPTLKKHVIDRTNPVPRLDASQCVLNE